MTTEQKIIKTKVGVLDLTKPLGNVSKACRLMGYNWDNFYRFKRKKIYLSLDELQTDLDGWLQDYNKQRPHQRGASATVRHRCRRSLRVPLAKEKCS